MEMLSDDWDDRDNRRLFQKSSLLTHISLAHVLAQFLKSFCFYQFPISDLFMTDERNKSALLTKINVIISRIIITLMLTSLKTKITVVYHYFT